MLNKIEEYCQDELFLRVDGLDQAVIGLDEDSMPLFTR